MTADRDPLAESPASCVVGKFYSVPCVFTLKLSRIGPGWIPVIGPLHADDGPVAFPWEHWHIDWRFVRAKYYEKEVRFYDNNETMVYAAVINLREQSAGKRMLVDDAGVQMHRMKCRRVMPPYPIASATRKWLPELNAQFKDCLAKNGICPHRGIPLVGHTVDGVTTCPGHGLRWRCDTGELVTA